jgi:hypothetical protein
MCPGASDELPIIIHGTFKLARKYSDLESSIWTNFCVFAFAIFKLWYKFRFEVSLFFDMFALAISSGIEDEIRADKVSIPTVYVGQTSGSNSFPLTYKFAVT